MAEATEMILTGVRSARVGEERREVRLSVTYALGMEEERLERVTAVKMTEVERGITAAWKALERKEQMESISHENIETERIAPEPVPTSPDDDEEVYPGEDENGEEPEDEDEGDDADEDEGEDREPFPAHPSERRPDYLAPPSGITPAYGQQPSGAINSAPPVSHSAQPVPAEPVVLVSKVQLLAIRPLLTKLNFNSNDTRDLLQKFFKKWTLERLTRDEANDLLVSLRRGEIEVQQKRQGAPSPGMNSSYTNGSRAH